MACSKMVVADKQCDEHYDELLDMYCKKCKIPVCETCVKLYHLTHDWCKLSKLIQDFHGHAQERARLIRESHVFGLRRNLTTVLSLKNENAQRNFANISGIIRKKERIIDRVIEISDRLIKKCEKDYSRVNERLTGYERDLLNSINDCVDIANAYEKSTDLISGYQFIRMETRLQSYNHFVQPIDFSEVKDMALFSDVSIDGVKLEKIFGKITQTEKLDSSVTQEGKGRQDEKVLYTILPMTENQAWTKLPDIKRNELVTNLMNVLELTSSCVDADCISFVAMENGDQIFTRLTDMSVCKMTSEGAVSELRSTYPWQPTGICKSATEGVLVSVLNTKLGSPLLSTGGALLHLTENGQLIKSYETSTDDNTVLFPHPFKAVQNGNTDICIVDYLTNDRTKLRVIGADGVSKFGYWGQNMSRNFDISGICCDDRYRIILCDCRNHAIHLLNSNGVFLRFLLTQTDGLEFPFHLTLYKNTLWINCAFGKTKVLKY